MNAPMRKVWTRETFFEWAAAQEERYEFDGFAPELMTGGTMNHSLITSNIHTGLRARLRETACRALGPDAGVATVGGAVRYPDGLVRCTAFAGRALLAPEPVVIFEVIGHHSGRRDRIVTMREYRGVPSIKRYVIVESIMMGATVLSRGDSGPAWLASELIEGETLELPEIAIGIPVVEFYEGSIYPMSEFA